MKKNSVVLTGILLLLSVFIYAINVAYHWADLPTLPTTKNVIEDSDLDHVDSSTKQNFSISIPSNVLLEDDFEGANTNWTFTTSNAAMRWYIGSAVKVGGTKSMYISDDNGVSNSYSGTNSVLHAVSKVITLDSTTTDYLFSLEWRAKAESNWDYLTLWVVPETFVPTDDYAISASTSGGMEIAKISEQPDFEKLHLIKDLSKFKGTKVKIVFQWLNDGSVFNSPAGAIDNFEFAKVTCTAPLLEDLNVSNITLTGAQFDWTSVNNTGKDFDVYIGDSATLPTNPVGIINLKNTTNHTISSLVSSTYYYVWYRISCATGDESFWVGPLKFMTLCSTLNLPFIEEFSNTNSLTLGCWSDIDVANDGTGASINKWRLISNNAVSGDDLMFFEGENKQHDDYLVSPSFTLTGGMYRLEFDYKTGSTEEDVDLVLSTTGKASVDFTTIIDSQTNYLSGNFKRKTVMLNGITGEVTLAWRLRTNGVSKFYIDNVNLTATTCSEATDLMVKEIGVTSATIEWIDTIGSNWEYYVQPLGFGLPSANGTVVATPEANFMVTSAGVALTADSEYEFFVRTKCPDNTYGQWIGPFMFKTLCQPIVTLPFEEGFNTASATFSCWNIVDKGNDKSVDGLSRVWRQNDSGMYEGDRSIYFSGGATPNDDWLISPAITMNATLLYEVSFYYKTGNGVADITLLASNTGVELDKFTVLEPKIQYKSYDYAKKVFYVESMGGNVNLAWQVNSAGSSTVFIDEVTIKEASCKIPNPNVEVSNLQVDKATFTWTDTINTSWQVYVQAKGGPTVPVGGGASTLNKSITVDRLNTVGGGSLQSNTEYEFFVRGVCGSGKQSSWVGPIVFRTPCSDMVLPYFEGFNLDSTTIDCWNVVDNSGQNSTSFELNQYDNYEGTSHVNLNNWFDDITDHYLISPNIKVDKTKIYKVSYFYKSSSFYTNRFEVLMSTTGTAIDAFTTTRVPMKTYTNINWEEKVFYISGIDATVNIAFHTQADTNVDFSIDAFSVTEITCAQPIDLDVVNIKDKEVTLNWSDSFNTEWEYAVIKSSSTTPKAPKVNGIVTKTKSPVITTDFVGNALETNTRYVYYVRSNCSVNEKSEWIGPFEFYTDCGVQEYPFWEGFNSTEKTMRCWTILDVAGDGDNYTQKWNQYSYSMFEGDKAMYFNAYSSSTATHDDWLISPDFKAVPTKYYRLKYHYRATTSYENEFEVKLSTTGTTPASFTQTLVPLASNNDNQYKQVTKFFTGVNGTFNIGFHVLGSGPTTLYLDNVFIEEVQGCPEPLNVTVDGITKDKGTVSWTDDFGATKWEYYVQKSGGQAPLSTTNGTATSTKQNVLTKEQNGALLLPGNEYDVYIRTVCGNGEYSIWQGPVEFMTVCDTFNLPFVESFDTSSTTSKCWVVVDNNDDNYYWNINSSYPYEGDRGSSLYGNVVNDEWLISPTFKMTNGNYVLKFRYQTGSGATSTPMEVLLSSNGTAISEFKHTLIAEKVYKDKNYVEEVLFFTGIPGDVNIAWHIKSDISVRMNIDNVSITEVKACPEPYNVQATTATATTIDVSWSQNGGVTNWEVLALPHEESIPTTPTGLVTVSGTPSATLTIASNKAYDIYVRAKCANGTDVSDWSTKIIVGTKTANDECDMATVVPINQGLNCDLFVSSSTMEATKTNIKLPSCQDEDTIDVWYEFTADDKYLSVSILDLIVGKGAVHPRVSIAVYQGTCATINVATPLVFNCYSLASDTGDYNTMISNLIPGTKYYLRVGLPTGEYYFNLCLSNNKDKQVRIEASGTPGYSVDQLVKEVLIKSNCDLVENVSYRAGDNSSINTFGYFNKGNSNFPFEEGIVLTTQAIDKTTGPYDPDISKQKVPGWVGDPDLNDVINSIGGAGFGNTKYVSVLEFDFTPIKDSIKFDYIFASESYVDWCSYVCESGGALFAAWLTEIESGEGQNLALVPGTEDPIALSSIRDTKKSGAACSSINPEFYGQHYYEGPDNPLEAPINYAGVTVPMSSETVYVKPGKKYRIKLAIADFCGNTEHTSAVFFKAGSFDLGNLDLGADLLVDTGNALCDSSSKVINSGLGTENIDITWYKNDVEIPGEKTPTLEVFESGTYKVVGNYAVPPCPVEGSVVVEIFPAINTLVDKPTNMNICRYSLNAQDLDLVSHISSMFKSGEKEKFSSEFYLDKELTTPILESDAYVFTDFGTTQKIYVRITDIHTGCFEVFDFALIPTEGGKPNKPSDVIVCGSYELPVLLENQFYYSEPGGQGVAYKAGDILIDGLHTMYILQDNGNGCYEEISYTIKVTPKVTAKVFEDQNLSCKLYELENLDVYSQYFIEVNGVRIPALAGTLIYQTNTKVYVVAKSEDGICIDESSFVVRYEECPIPKGISPNGDGYNDRFDLSDHGVSSIQIFNRNGSEIYSFNGLYTDQWDGKGKNKKDLPSGTYFYVIQSFDKTRTGWVELSR